MDKRIIQVSLSVDNLFVLVQLFGDFRVRYSTVKGPNKIKPEQRYWKT